MKNKAFAFLNVKKDSCESFVETSCVEPGAFNLEGAGGQKHDWLSTTHKATIRPTLEALPLLKPRLDINLRKKYLLYSQKSQI